MERTLTTFSTSSGDKRGSSGAGWYLVRSALNWREFNFEHVELIMAKSSAVYFGACKNNER